MVIITVPWLLGACRKNNYYPKPIAYQRIDYPHKGYKNLSGPTTALTFEYPVICTVTSSPLNDRAVGYTLHFNAFHANLYLTCTKTGQTASALKQFEQTILNQIKDNIPPLKTTYKSSNQQHNGVLYLVEGFTPSPLHLAVYDQKGHLLTGSLVFNQVINPDSIPEVLSGMRYDVQHLIETLKF